MTSSPSFNTDVAHPDREPLLSTPISVNGHPMPDPPEEVFPSRVGMELVEQRVHGDEVWSWRTLFDRLEEQLERRVSVAERGVGGVEDCVRCSSAQHDDQDAQGKF